MAYGYTLLIADEDAHSITLSNGCIFSKQDSDLVPYVTKSLDGYGYARMRYNHQHWKDREKAHRVVMSRILMCALPPRTVAVVDHINNNKLDNRRENLQLISHRNNITKNSKRGSSRFFRVGAHETGRWRVAFVVDDTPEYFGLFWSEEEAAFMADVWAVRLLDKDVLLNYPNRFQEALAHALTLPCDRAWKRNIFQNLSYI